MDIQPVTLEGRHVRLVPMEMSHHAALTAIGLDPALWRHTTIRVQTPEEMGQYMETALAGREAGTALPFVIARPATGEIVGTTRYHSIVREHRRLEIGFTWIAQPWQRTAVNTEAKFLLLQHAFETLGCQRVEFKAAAENESSRRALLRIGATEEGTLRHYVRSKHKGPCDVRVFSILAGEWESLSARLRSASPELRPTFDPAPTHLRPSFDLAPTQLRPGSDPGPDLASTPPRPGFDAASSALRPSVEAGLNLG